MKLRRHLNKAFKILNNVMLIYQILAPKYECTSLEVTL